MNITFEVLNNRKVQLEDALKAAYKHVDEVEGALKECNLMLQYVLQAQDKGSNKPVEADNIAR